MEHQLLCCKILHSSQCGCYLEWFNQLQHTMGRVFFTLTRFMWFCEFMWKTLHVKENKVHNILVILILICIRPESLIATHYLSLMFFEKSTFENGPRADLIKSTICIWCGRELGIQAPPSQKLLISGQILIFRQTLCHDKSCQLWKPLRQWPVTPAMKFQSSYTCMKSHD